MVLLHPRLPSAHLSWRGRWPRTALALDLTAWQQQPPARGSRRRSPWSLRRSRHQRQSLGTGGVGVALSAAEVDPYMAVHGAQRAAELGHPCCCYRGCGRARRRPHCCARPAIAAAAAAAAAGSAASTSAAKDSVLPPTVCRRREPPRRRGTSHRSGPCGSLLVSRRPRDWGATRVVRHGLGPPPGTAWRPPAPTARPHPPVVGRLCGPSPAPVLGIHGRLSPPSRLPWSGYAAIGWRGAPAPPRPCRQTPPQRGPLR